MVRESGVAVAVGAVLGLAMFISLGRLLSTLLYETSSSDPRIMAGVATGLVSLALAAAWLQARRLAGVSPIVALRGEDGTR
jgi:putative ABC transport system permease protein